MTSMRATDVTCRVVEKINFRMVVVVVGVVVVGVVVVVVAAVAAAVAAVAAVGVMTKTLKRGADADCWRVIVDF
jgi:hypothetical protein